MLFPAPLVKNSGAVLTVLNESKGNLIMDLLGELFGDQSAPKVEEKQKKEKKKRRGKRDVSHDYETAVVPRPWVTACMFPPKPRKEPWVATMGRWEWTFGRDLHGEDVGPGLDIRHFIVICAILSDPEHNPAMSDCRHVPVSLSALCRRIYNYEGGAQIKELYKRLNELKKCWVTVRDLWGKCDTQCFTILSDVGYRIKPKITKNGFAETQVDELELSKKFCELINKMLPKRQTRCINWKEMLKMSSPVAQAIWVYLPSRTINYTRENAAWTIGLKTILNELGEPVPEYRSKRKEKFTKCRQGGKSIVGQLDGSELHNGAKLRVSLEKCRDGEDFKLATFIEANKANFMRWLRKERKTDLYKAWIAGGRSEEAYIKQLKKPYKVLEPYQVTYLDNGGVEYSKKTKPLFVKMRKLMGDDWFNGYAADCQNNKCTNATGYFIGQLMGVIRGDKEAL